MMFQKQTHRKKSISSQAVSGKASLAGQLAFRSDFNDIGNPKGVIIPRKMMNIAGIQNNNDVNEAKKGENMIHSIEEHIVNTDLSTWAKQFKDAFKAGQIPDKDLFKI
jgi:antitoxin component of MazEF toxin-antitoxin module